MDPNPAQLSQLARIRRPVTKLCEGWHCAFWASPNAFRRLPLDTRVSKARSVLGPAGSWWLKDRIDGVVETLVGHRVQRAVTHGSGVRLILDGPQASTLDVDHVIAATGFRVDIGRLAFLPEPLLAGVATIRWLPPPVTRRRVDGARAVLRRSRSCSEPRALDAFHWRNPLQRSALGPFCSSLAQGQKLPSDPGTGQGHSPTSNDLRFSAAMDSGLSEPALVSCAKPLTPTRRPHGRSPTRPSPPSCANTSGVTSRARRAKNDPALRSFRRSHAWTWRPSSPS